MNLLNPGQVSNRRVWIARFIAVAADILQITVFPVFIEGFASPVDAVVDVIVAAALILLVGWHIAFIPSFLIKALPIADLAPTWTVAILIAARGQTPCSRQPELIASQPSSKPAADSQ